jgi:hypothetical protein
VFNKKIDLNILIEYIVTKMNSTKCSSCKCLYDNADFTYNNKTYKTCNKCRNKRKKKQESKPIEEPKSIEKPKPIEEVNPFEQFIRHQKKFKKLNQQFLDRAAKPVHMYNMRTIFTDIRDLWCPSSES